MTFSGQKNLKQLVYNNFNEPFLQIDNEKDNDPKNKPRLLEEKLRKNVECALRKAGLKLTEKKKRSIRRFKIRRHSRQRRHRSRKSKSSTSVKRRRRKSSLSRSSSRSSRNNSSRRKRAKRSRKSRSRSSSSSTTSTRSSSRSSRRRRSRSRKNSRKSSSSRSSSNKSSRSRSRSISRSSSSSRKSSDSGRESRSRSRESRISTGRVQAEKSLVVSNILEEQKIVVEPTVPLVEPTIDLKSKILEICKEQHKNACLEVLSSRMYPQPSVMPVNGGVVNKSVGHFIDMCKNLSTEKESAEGLVDVNNLKNKSSTTKPQQATLLPVKTVSNTITSNSSLSVETMKEKVTETLVHNFPVSSGTKHRETLDTNTDTGLNDVNKEIFPVESTKTEPILTTEEVKSVAKFTGQNDACLLKPEQLGGDFKAWSRKDMLKNAAPITAGIGKKILEKMGWKDGNGLGKEQTGAIVPFTPDVKVNRSGLSSEHDKMGKMGKKVVNKIQNPALKPPLIAQKLAQTSQNTTLLTSQSALNFASTQPLQNTALLPSPPLFSFPSENQPYAQTLQNTALLPSPPFCPNPSENQPYGHPQSLMSKANIVDTRKNVSEVFIVTNNKNPVSSLNELCQKRNWEMPFYETMQTYDQYGMIRFITQVIVDGKKYWEPETKTSRNKKDSKANAAIVALQELGFMKK